MKKLAVMSVVLILLFASSGLCAFRPAAIGDLFHKGASGFDVRSYGAVGDGSTDDEPAFTLAIAAAAGGRVIVVEADTSYRLSSNVTVPAGVTIVFQQGGLLLIDNGITFTVNGTMHAGMYQIFSGTGTVSIARGAVEYLLPHWWGAVGDGVADDTAEIQAALTAAELKVRKVHLPPGDYLTSSQLSLRYANELFGGGRESTTIIVGEADGSGILVDHVVDDLPYEGAVLRDFRIYSLTTPVAGIGIDVNADRDCLIERVWIGGWHSGAMNTDKHGFNKAIQFRLHPAYYTNVRLCMLMRNTYGVYYAIGANEFRVENNQIWYGSWGVYVEEVGGGIIANNSIEGYDTLGIYSEGIEIIIKDNRLESSGVQPIELGADADRNRIVGNHAITGLGSTETVLNNSDEPTTHRIDDSHIIVGHHNAGSGNPAGRLTANLYNFSQTEFTIEALSHDLLIRSAYEDNISVQSALGVDRGAFNTPIFGAGDYANNIQKSSELFTNWSGDGDILTKTDDAAVAPDGSTTAARIVSNSDTGNIFILTNTPDFVQGDLLQISVWLRSETAHNGRLLWQIDSSTRISDTAIWIDTRWRRYVMSLAAPITPVTNMGFLIAPGADSPTFVWGAQITKGTTVTGTDDSGVNNKTTKLVDTGTNFRTSGIDIGGEIQTIAANTAAKGNITGINTLLNYNTGSGTEPSVGDTITGDTSGATGTIAEVIIASGSFAGNNAAGTMEVTPVTRTFEAEDISFDGDSATVASVNADCVLVTSFAAMYGAKADADNGDTYYAWSSIQRAPKPYVPTNAAIADFHASTTPTSVVEDLLGTHHIRTAAGFLKQATVIDPLSENKSFSHDDQTTRDTGQIFILDPDADGRTINFIDTIPDGVVIDILNINAGSNRVQFVDTGDFIGAGERGTFVYQDAAWYTLHLTQDLRSVDTPTFAEVISGNEMFIPATDFTPEGDGSNNATVEHDRVDPTNRWPFERATGISDTQDMDWYTLKDVSQTPTSLTIYTRASDRANCAITMTIVVQAAGTPDATGAVVMTPAVDDVWEEFTYTFTSAYANDDELFIKIAVTSLDTGDTADFTRAKLNY